MITHITSPFNFVAHAHRGPLSRDTRVGLDDSAERGRERGGNGEAAVGGCVGISAGG